MYVASDDDGSPKNLPNYGGRSSPTNFNPDGNVDADAELTTDRTPGELSSGSDSCSCFFSLCTTSRTALEESQQSSSFEFYDLRRLGSGVESSYVDSDTEDSDSGAVSDMEDSGSSSDSTASGCDSITQSTWFKYPSLDSGTTSSSRGTNETCSLDSQRISPRGLVSMIYGYNGHSPYEGRDEDKDELDSRSASSSGFNIQDRA